MPVHGGARTLVGPAGIGKTAVLDEVVRQVRADLPDVRVIRLRGVEAELEMAWSGLAGLLDDLLDRVAELPPARADAILGALALADGGRVEPFAVAVATRDLLAEAAKDDLVLIAVDDVPWIDLPTRHVLVYLAEHVELEHIALIATRRDDALAAIDLGAVVDVGGIDDDVGDALLVDAGVSSPDVRRRLLRAGRGNPLVLTEAANLLEPAERSGRAALPDPLPVGRSGRRSAELVLDRLDQPTRDALLVVAADADGDIARIAAALEANGQGMQGLEPALTAGVLRDDGDHLTFRHPLIRSATYHGASRGAQRAAHRALASTLPDAVAGAGRTPRSRRAGPGRGDRRPPSTLLPASPPTSALPTSPPARGRPRAVCRRTPLTARAVSAWRRRPSSTPATPRTLPSCSAGPGRSLPPPRTTVSSGSTASGSVAGSHPPSAGNGTPPRSCGPPLPVSRTAMSGWPPTSSSMPSGGPSTTARWPTSCRSSRRSSAFATASTTSVAGGWTSCTGHRCWYAGARRAKPCSTGTGR